MFSFRRVFPTHLANETRNTRTRILGVVNPNQILYLVVTSNKTEILLVDLNGDSKTVLAFNHYLDIISADLSSDFDLLAYTERIPNGLRFSFKSVLCHLHSFSNVKVFEDISPITSYFLPDNRGYQIVHIIGHRIVHFHAALVNKKLIIKQIRGGANISNCRSFYFDSKLLCALTPSNASLFTFKNKSYFSTVKPLEMREGVNLPAELAILPSVTANYPFYRFSNGNMYAVKIRNEYAVIEQLYRGQNTPLAFSITVFDQFIPTKIIEVPNVQPDIPINFVHYESVVFVFAVNCFTAMIDFTVLPPAIYFLPRALCTGPTSNLTVTTNNFTIDIETGEVYRLSISLKEIPNIANFNDTTVLRIFATLIARLPSFISISSVIRRIPNEPDILLCFFQILFKIGMMMNVNNKVGRLKHAGRTVNDLVELRPPLSKELLFTLEDMDREFPSIGKYTRIDTFLLLLKQYRMMNVRDIQKVAIRHLQIQNRLVLSLRAAIDEWINKYSPDDAHKFALSIALLSEAKNASTPEVPCLELECEEAANEICSETVKMHLRCANLIGIGNLTNNRYSGELKYWGARLPPEIKELKRGTRISSMSSLMVSKKNDQHWSRSDLSSSESSTVTDL
ncbi:hypothetical protein TRFO_33294 [Tritrichomonas foetus]|uniref:Uncharacterized protein n=1 Tax=Tritrichomonas foetus TaxID=1144522 RepID=A0A1J4JLT4_9EUKA|nr:hypothetical protein TRFO_33294 [Tritrichomonas foetus]|eukprot:OHT00063.1 hypothetical protein TRFO_33294 [Tritrichomonas foetus]